ncbi:hypothetical protein [Roseomonas marmotae]|uniref:hypothetical protein n=1 Tax=Roseomonas marmotae TaxID=2768161 RepID=UPI001F45E28C|nr:hypothetical protein [Roseomonas marmotae]
MRRMPSQSMAAHGGGVAESAIIMPLWPVDDVRQPRPAGSAGCDAGPIWAPAQMSGFGSAYAIEPMLEIKVALHKKRERIKALHHATSFTSFVKSVAVTLPSVACSMASSFGQDGRSTPVSHRHTVIAPTPTRAAN